MMKLGGFGFLKDYDVICAAGFDYAELDMPEIAELTDADLSHMTPIDALNYLYGLQSRLKNRI